MANTTNFLAFDLGASGGRAMVGRFDGERLALEEVHRFANGPTRLVNRLHWDALNLFNEMKTGLGKAVEQLAGNLTALGVDTWGVDFALLDKHDNLIGNPYHYRDSRTEGMIEQAFERVSHTEIFSQTGIQLMHINTLFQLLSMKDSPALAAAQTLLMMPDLLNFWFTGQKACEYTDASTSQCFNMAEGRWATELLARLDLPTHMFLDVIPPGTQLGPLLPHLAEDAGLKQAITVIAPGSHDTASAVAAVPVMQADAANFAYISSGTWSLVGAEVQRPVINDQSLHFNFTNEGGVERTVRLLKNLTGLWLVQECRRIWALEGSKLTWAELTDLAEVSQPLLAFIDPDDPVFFSPGDMAGRIVEFCRKSGQAVPDSKGAILRCALESLALKYRWTIERVENLTGQPVEVVHLVGGGTQNKLLNQFTADATGRRVVIGPGEATATGNILIQMLATGQISSLTQGREIVRASFPVENYEPQNRAAWGEAYQRFVKLLA
jgi:rhamnulokinase